MARTHSGNKDFFFCPVCHAELPIRAKVCPECGNDEETGWKNHDLDSEDDPLDYIDFVKREIYKEKTVKPRGVKTWVWLVAALLAGFFIYSILRTWNWF
jgi:hypothetical protein